MDHKSLQFRLAGGTLVLHFSDETERKKTRKIYFLSNKIPLLGLTGFAYTFNVAS